MILPKKKVFQNIKNKVVFKNLDDSGVLSSDFPGPRTSAASLTSSASATSLASTASKALFHQKKLPDPGKLGHRHCRKPLSYGHRSKADVRLASSNDDLVYGICSVG